MLFVHAQSMRKCGKEIEKMCKKNHRNPYTYCHDRTLSDSSEQTVNKWMEQISSAANANNNRTGNQLFNSTVVGGGGWRDGER